jgi:hypothetical protein
MPATQVAASQHLVAQQTSSGTVFARPTARIIVWPTRFGLRFPRKTRRKVPERDVTRHLRNVLRLSIAVNLPLPPRFSAGAAVVMLEHRAAAHVKTTYVPIELRVIRIARVKLTALSTRLFEWAAHRGRHSTLSLVIRLVGSSLPAIFPGVIIPGSRRRIHDLPR